MSENGVTVEPSKSILECKDEHGQSMVEIRQDGFYVRGFKLEQDEGEAQKLADGFKALLMGLNLWPPCNTAIVEIESCKDCPCCAEDEGDGYYSPHCLFSALDQAAILPEFGVKSVEIDDEFVIEEGIPKECPVNDGGILIRKKKV